MVDVSEKWLLDENQRLRKDLIKAKFAIIDLIKKNSQLLDDIQGIREANERLTNNEAGVE